MDFLSFIKQLLKKKSTYQSLNTITIKKQAIEDNFLLFQHHKPTYQIIPVLKSNAYGHGIKQITSILSSLPSCKIIAIDSYPEYQIVADHSDKQILLLGETWWINYNLMDHRRTHLAVRNSQTIKILWQTHKPWKIHLFINTGMNREWVSLEDLPALIQSIKTYPYLQIAWVMSHLACADQKDHPLNAQQVAVFHQAVDLIRREWCHPTYIHLEATGGMINEIDTTWVCNTWRLWLWLYGYDPLYNSHDGVSSFGRKLIPAMDVYSTVTSLQTIKHHQSIGYGASRINNNTEGKMGITFPFGYKEWIRRSLSWRWLPVMIDGEYYEIVWKVSMNYTSCILQANQWSNKKSNQLAIGSKVHIISSQLSDKHTWYNYYDRIDALIYEIVDLDSSIKRIVIN